MLGVKKMRCKICGGETHSLKSICDGCKRAELYRRNPHLKDMEQMMINWANRIEKEGEKE